MEPTVLDPRNDSTQLDHLRKVSIKGPIFIGRELIRTLKRFSIIN